MPNEKSRAVAVGLEADLQNETERDLTANAREVGEQDIAALAYELWKARGCPVGSPEQDWFSAVEQLHSRN